MGKLFASICVISALGATSSLPVAQALQPSGEPIATAAKKKKKKKKKPCLLRSENTDGLTAKITIRTSGLSCTEAKTTLEIYMIRQPLDFEDQNPLGWSCSGSLATGACRSESGSRFTWTWPV